LCNRIGSVPPIAFDKWTDHLPLLYPFERKSSEVAPTRRGTAPAKQLASPRLSNREQTMTARIWVAVIGRRSSRNRIRSEDLASENLDLLAACDVDPDDAKHGCTGLRSAAMVYRSGKNVSREKRLVDIATQMDALGRRSISRSLFVSPTIVHIDDALISHREAATCLGFTSTSALSNSNARSCRRWCGRARRCPAAPAMSTMALVICAPACDGVGSPEGWLCMSTSSQLSN
jgi:hypothetical protein